MLPSAYLWGLSELFRVKHLARCFNKEGTYAHLRLIQVDVWQKTTKFFRAIILQLKNKLKNLHQWITLVFLQLSIELNNSIFISGRRKKNFADTQLPTQLWELLIDGVIYGAPKPTSQGISQDQNLFFSIFE